MSYFVEPKVDGVAVSLRYEHGRLVQAVTRGDGRRGDDVTQNARTIRAIPLSLSQPRTGGLTSPIPSIPTILEIRGEVVMPNDEFVRINQLRSQAGEDDYANPRNVTAGTLKQLDPRAVAQRELLFIAHGRGHVERDPFATHSQFLEAVRAWGVPTSPWAQVCSTLQEVWQFIETFDAQRHSLGYGVDGVVVKVDRYDLQDQLGATSKSPRWCIAYKYPAEQATTRLLRVDWQVGKSGRLTPRAVMEPVFLAGSTVQHASLHNLGEVRRKDIRVGDTVVIEKAGEIIPQIVSVMPGRRPGTATPVIPPGRPARFCGGPVMVEYDQKRVNAIESWPRRVKREAAKAEKEGHPPSDIPEPLPLTKADETARLCINPSARRSSVRSSSTSPAALRWISTESGKSSSTSCFRRSGQPFCRPLPADCPADRGPDRMAEKSAANVIQGIRRSKERGLARVLAAWGLNISVRLPPGLCKSLQGLPHPGRGVARGSASRPRCRAGRRRIAKPLPALKRWPGGL